MSYSPPTSIPTSPHWKLHSPQLPTDEKSFLLSEIRKLSRKVESKEEVIRELNQTILSEEFQQNSEGYVNSLIVNSLTSSMDLTGRKVRSFFKKNSSIESESLEIAIKDLFGKVHSLHQKILTLKEIDFDPKYQKNPRPYLEQWLTDHPESIVNEIIAEIFKSVD